MKATVCHPSELGPAETARWRDIQRAHPAVRHPFLSPEFAQAFGAGKPTARVAVVEDGNDVAGFFAFDRNRLGIARPVGGRLSFRQGFVHTAGLPWTWPELMSAARVHGVEVTDLLGAQAAGAPRLVVSPSRIVDTSIGWDAYFETVRKHGRVRNLLKHGRRLQRDLGPVEFSWGPVEPGELARLVEWKSKQYRRSGWPDPFARPWVRSTLDALVRRSDGELQTVSSTLRAGDNLLAVEVSLVFQSVYAAWFTTYNRDFAAYSPGSLCLLGMLERACENGFAYVDLARGDEDFKRVFANAQIDVAGGLVRDRSPQSFVYASIREPYRALRAFVVRHPRMRSFARSSLRRFGALRVHEPPPVRPGRRRSEKR